MTWVGHQFKILLCVGAFLLVGGWSVMTSDRSWWTRSRVQRYLILVVLATLMRELLLD